MPTSGSGHIGGAVRYRRPDGFRWSTLTDRGPRAPAGQRRGGCSPAPRPEAPPEAGQLQAFLRGYSLNNTNPARKERGLFGFSISGPQSLNHALKRLRNAVTG